MLRRYAYDDMMRMDKCTFRRGAVGSVLYTQVVCWLCIQTVLQVCQTSPGRQVDPPGLGNFFDGTNFI
jgi:hypothetical protein